MPEFPITLLQPAFLGPVTSREALRLTPSWWARNACGCWYATHSVHSPLVVHVFSLCDPRCLSLFPDRLSNQFGGHLVPLMLWFSSRQCRVMSWLSCCFFCRLSPLPCRRCVHLRVLLFLMLLLLVYRWQGLLHCNVLRLWLGFNKHGIGRRRKRSVPDGKIYCVDQEFVARCGKQPAVKGSVEVTKGRARVGILRWWVPIVGRTLDRA